MRITIYCEFLEDTANGIVMKGRAAALAGLGNRVRLFYQPYKYPPPRKERVVRHGANLIQSTIISRLFVCPKLLRLWYLPSFLLYDMPRILLPMLRSDLVILHKPMPLSLLYLLALTLAGRRKKTVVILDDWEGIGGYANIRNSESIFNRMLVTLSEEWAPVLAGGVMCASKLLFEKMRLSEKTRDKCLYLPNGGPAVSGAGHDKGKKPAGLPVVYVGTYKSPLLVDFLLSVISLTKQVTGEIRYTLVGGGPLLDTLKERRERDGLSSVLECTGQVPPEEALLLMGQSAVCLLVLTPQYPETFMDASRSSVKLFEYMAYGKIVLATDFGEAAQILTHQQTGLLAPSDPKAFAGMLLDIHRNFGKYEKIGAEAKRKFEREYTHDILMKSLLEWRGKLPR